MNIKFVFNITHLPFICQQVIQVCTNLAAHCIPQLFPHWQVSKALKKKTEKAVIGTDIMDSQI